MCLSGTTTWNPIGLKNLVFYLWNRNSPGISHAGQFSVRRGRLQAWPTAASFDQFQLTSRILVVEDVPGNLKVVRIIFSKQGFEVHTAGTAEEALEMARKIHPRLILADIYLFTRHGRLEMTRRLKADPETMDIVVVALTALAKEGDEQKALAAGCDGYTPKPIDVKTRQVVGLKSL
jgi:two-component system cell cycle response regulator DivK